MFLAEFARNGKMFLVEFARNGKMFLVEFARNGKMSAGKAAVVSGENDVGNRRNDSFVGEWQLVGEDGPVGDVF